VTFPPSSSPERLNTQKTPNIIGRERKKERKNLNEEKVNEEEEAKQKRLCACVCFPQYVYVEEEL
jgi:hypothetical protein